MKYSTTLSLPILSVSVAVSLTAVSLTAVSNVWAADQLDNIMIEDTVVINPNTSTPEVSTRSRATSADGADLLRQINGVSISRFGGRGLEPVIRGQSQTRLNVLLDGAYIHGGCPNRMDPPTSWAALETYENVTVLKGVQSLAYGGGGSGGTVLFERDTRELAEEKGIHGRVSAMGSDNGIEHDFLADVVGAGKKGYVRGLAQIKKGGNYEDGSGREVRSSYDHKQGGIILGVTPTEDRLFEFSFEQNSFRDALYPGAGMDSPEENADIFRLRYLDKPATSKIDSIKAEFYLSDVDHLMDNFSLRPNMGIKMATPTTSKTVGGRVNLQSTLNNTTKLEYGIDIQNNERDAVLNNVTAGKSVSLMWPDVSIDQTGLFAEITKKLANKQRIKYGARVDFVDVSHAKASVASEATGRTANQSYQFYHGTTATDKDETNVGALLRYEKDLNKGVSFFTGISRSVRTADASERGMNKWVLNPAQRWVGNPDLDPEKHHQFDVGMSKKTQNYDVSGNIFYDKVEDYILRDAAADGANIYRNVDARLYGIELESRFKLSERLDLTSSLAYVHATNTTDDRAIAQTPPLNGKLQLDYSKNRWSLGSRINFSDKQDRIDTLSPQEVGVTPGNGTVDLYGNYRVSNNVNLRLGFDNVLDKTYAEHASRSNLFDTTAIKVNEPGRTAWAKLTVDF